MSAQVHLRSDSMLGRWWNILSKLANSVFSCYSCAKCGIAKVTVSNFLRGTTLHTRNQLMEVM